MYTQLYSWRKELRKVELWLRSLWSRLLCLRNLPRCTMLEPCTFLNHVPSLSNLARSSSLLYHCLLLLAMVAFNPTWFILASILIKEDLSDSLQIFLISRMPHKMQLFWINNRQCLPRACCHHTWAGQCSPGDPGYPWDSGAAEGPAWPATTHSKLTLHSGSAQARDVQGHCIFW